jgi:CDP-diacylglycerol pyrophosphatase
VRAEIYHRTMSYNPASAFGVVIVLAAGASASCSGSQSKCDPIAIVVHDKCFLDKDRACDEIGCVPPNECVELDKSPPQIECRKP